ncbi:MAG: glycosyltransferase [Candidatus Thorarchaeota archaeon]
MKILALRVLAWDITSRLPQRIDFIKERLTEFTFYDEINISPVRALGYYLGYIIGFILTIPRLLRKKYDILLVENAYLVVFGVFSRLSKRKVIAEYVDYYPDMLQRIYLTRRLRFYVAVMLCRIFSKLANSVIVETQLSKKIVIRLGISPSKIRVIRQSPDQSFLKRTVSGNLRKTLKIGEDEFIVGYLGKFTPHYGLELIPHAVGIAQEKTKRKLTLLMIGDGVLLPEIKNLATQYNVERATFTGRVPFREVTKYYSIFDALLYTPDTASGIKLAEAMVIGVPPIVSAGYAAEVVKDGINGFVTKARTPDGYAEKIIEVEQLSGQEISNVVNRVKKYAFDRFVLAYRQYLHLFNGVYGIADD